MWHFVTAFCALGGAGAGMGGVGLAEARGMTLRHRHCLNAAVRSIYRHAVVEPVLIALFGVQIALGLALVWRRGRPSGAWALA